MSFQDSSDTIQSRLHLGNIRPAWLVLGLALAAVVIALAAQAVVSLVADHGFTVTHEQGQTAQDPSGEAEDSQSEAFEADISEPVISLICVHVSGCVGSPGVYYLKEGARVHEALECAGGLSESAAPAYLNEARILQDGEHLVVPSVEEVAALGAGAVMPLTE